MAASVTPSTGAAAAATPGVPVVAFAGVSKRYGAYDALADVSLTVRRGEIFGLIGPSGSGKTTLVRLVVGLSGPSGGHALTLGVAPVGAGARHAERIGYAPQESFVYPTLTAWANLMFVGSLYGMGWRHRRRRARDVLRALGLWDARGRRTDRLSSGMRRRLLLGAALLHEPELLVVDEPTAGLDPALRKTTWDILTALPARGVTTFVTTQLLEEAAHCDRIGMLDRGRLIAVGTPDELRRRSAVGEVVTIAVDGLDEHHVDAIRALPGVRSARRVGPDTLRITADDGARATPAITELLFRDGAHVRTVDTQPASFDEIFLRLLER